MKKTIIIAEAGVNHNGNINNAYRLIDTAINAGVDYVKFQTWKTELVVSEDLEKAEYQKKNTGVSDESMFSMLKKLELTQDDFIALKKYCDEKGIGFLTTPFDLDSMDFVYELGVDYMKIPSGEITNLPLLQKANEHSNVPVILSTGMSNLDEITAALGVLKDCDVNLLHCTTQYPTPYKDVNLRAIDLLKEKYKLPVGLSDHTLGNIVSVAATAKDIAFIEKHFTLDKEMQGPDHKASLSPSQLKELVYNVRIIEEAMGVKTKNITDSEKENLNIARKFVVANCNIKEGEVIKREMLTTKRAKVGISPMEINKIIGTKSIKYFKKDETICLK